MKQTKSASPLAIRCCWLILLFAASSANSLNLSQFLKGNNWYELIECDIIMKIRNNSILNMIFTDQKFKSKEIVSPVQTGCNWLIEHLMIYKT